MVVQGGVGGVGRTATMSHNQGLLGRGPEGGPRTVTPRATCTPWPSPLLQIISLIKWGVLPLEDLCYWWVTTRQRVVSPGHRCWACSTAVGASCNH